MYLDEYFAYQRSKKIAKSAISDKRVLMPPEVSEISRHLHSLIDNRHYEWVRDIFTMLTSMVGLYNDVFDGDIAGIQLFGQMIQDIWQRLDFHRPEFETFVAPAA